MDPTTLKQLYQLPFTDLLQQAQAVHRQHHPANTVKLCTSVSIKTGRCPEDCAFCPQSSHYTTFVQGESMMAADEIIALAEKGRRHGVDQVCLGAAWRKIPAGRAFDTVLTAVSGIRTLGLEVCCSMGFVSLEQAQALHDAGCNEYNHNLDTSRAFFSKVITTRSYDERLQTLESIKAAGLRVSCGGIWGMGESADDRMALIAELAALAPHPFASPMNALNPIPGTPLGNRPFIDAIDFARTVAVARIALPTTVLSLAGGRIHMSRSMQALAFMAGANCLYLGEKIFTSANPTINEDLALLRDLGLVPATPVPA